LPQGVGQKASGALEVFDEAQRPEAGQGLDLLRSISVLICVIHMRRTLPGRCPRAEVNVVWDASAAGTVGGQAAEGAA
jgi:hypothetical protein